MPWRIVVIMVVAFKYWLTSRRALLHRNSQDATDANRIGPLVMLNDNVEERPNK